LLTLRQKLILSFAVLILLTFVVSALSVYNFVRLGRVMDVNLADSYTGMVAGENMKDALQRIDAAAAIEREVDDPCHGAGIANSARC